MPKLRREQDAPKKLEKYITKNGFNYVQEFRLDDMAFYSQWATDPQWPDWQDCVGHEVFVVQVQEPQEITMGGQKIKLEHKEKFPANGAFGHTAWSVGSHLALSIKKFFKHYKNHRGHYPKVLPEIEDTDIRALFEIELKAVKGSPKRKRRVKA